MAKSKEEELEDQIEEEETATAATTGRVNTGLVDGSEDVRLSKLVSCRLKNGGEDQKSVEKRKTKFNDDENAATPSNSPGTRNSQLVPKEVDTDNKAGARYLPYLEESSPPPPSSQNNSYDIREHEAKDKEEQFDVMDVVRKRARLANEEEEREEEKEEIGSPQEQSEWNPQQQQQQQPKPQGVVVAGAYAEAFGESTKRRDDVRFSLVGAEPGQPISASTNNNVAFSLVGGPPDPQDIENLTNRLNSHAEEEGEGEYIHKSGNDGLAEAKPVVEGDEENAGGELANKMEAAQPYDVETAERKKLQNANHQRKSFLSMAIVVFVCIVVGFIIPLGIKLAGQKNNSSSSSIPSMLAPSLSPSSAPSGVLDSLLDSLSEETQQRICCNNPQYKAWEWLQNHPNITNLEEWRKKQLFALGTFFYSFEGEKWDPPIRDRWMDYNKEECLWFSNGYGIFCPLESGCNYNGTHYVNEYQDYIPFSSVDLSIEPSCNDDKRFTSFDLKDLGLPRGSKPSIPPEISLLTSLSKIYLVGNDGIDASLSDVLPLPELLQLTNLTQLSYYGIANDLTGPIPSQLGLMTNLLHLNLDNVALTGQLLPSELGLMTDAVTISLAGSNLGGSVPSQLGLMTKVEWLFLENNQIGGSISSQVGGMANLQWLDLYNNTLTGRLPTQLGLMTAMESLWLSQNRFTGAIPSQLGLLNQNLDHLLLENNALTGTIPSELESLVALNGGNLTGMSLGNNSFLSGTIPDGLCSLGEYDPQHLWRRGLSFDCSQRLCGCCWCPCSTVSSSACELD